MVRAVKEEQEETSIDILDPGSEQNAVEEGRDGLAGLRDLVVVVLSLNQLMKVLANIMIVYDCQFIGVPAYRL